MKEKAAKLIEKLENLNTDKTWGYALDEMSEGVNETLNEIFRFLYEIAEK